MCDFYQSILKLTVHVSENVYHCRVIIDNKYGRCWQHMKGIEHAVSKLYFSFQIATLKTEVSSEKKECLTHSYITIMTWNNFKISSLKNPGFSNLFVFLAGPW